jgi:hypothetical protein
MRRSFAAAVLLAMAGSLPAGEKAEQPKGPPPKVMIASVDKDGPPYIKRTVVEYRTEKRQVEVITNGIKQLREEQVTIPILREEKVGLDGKEVQVFGTDGKLISAKEVSRRLKKATAVLVSCDGKPVDPFYVRIAREGTLIVVAPSLASTGPMPFPPLPPKEQPPEKEPPKERKKP